MSPPSLVVARSSPGPGGMTVGWLLAIALGGGALLFVSLAFILVAVTDRRSHKARLQAEHESALVHAECDNISSDVESSLHTRQHRRRLTKSPQVTPSRAKRISLPHILPQIRRNSSILNLFGSPGQRIEKSKGPASRRKNSWIDEDAIHGPEMQRRTSRRISLRESWLIRRTPTLPTLLGYREEMESDVFYRHQNYPLMAPRPAVLPAEKQSPADKQPVSRMPLVRTPSYELAQQRAAAIRFDEAAEQESRAEDEKQQQQKQDEQHQPQDRQQQMAHDNIRYGPRPPPAAKLAKIRANTDSNLELILKNTAQRLREGSPGPSRKPTNGKNTSRPNPNPNPQMQVNQATRHRRSYASQESPVKGFRNDRPLSSAVLEAYRGVQKTPSPKKMPVQAMTTPQSAPAAVYQRQQGTPTKMSGALVVPHQSSHQRNMSTSSMLSEADSLFGETTVPDPGEPLAAGLSSPSRRPSQSDTPPAEPKPVSRRRSTSVPSMRSSVSSALSTVYSEEEPDLDRAMTMDQRLQSCKTSRPDSRLDTRGRRPRQQGHVPKMSDPFLTVVGPAPEVPQKSPRRLSAIMPELGYYQQPTSRGSQDASILGQISGNRQSATNSPVMSSLILGKERDNVRLSILMAPTQEHSGGQASMRPRSVVPMKPTFFAHSTSVASMKADPSTPEEDKRGGSRPRTSHGRKPSVVPPPLNLCPIEASPRVDQEEQLPTFNLQIQGPSGLGRSQSVESLPSSPPPNRPLPDPELMSPTHAYLQRMGFFNDGSPSRANSNASARSSQYSETNHGPREDFRSPSPVRPDAGYLYSPRNASSVVGGRSSPMRMSPLTASIVQLRRMNSQMSTYSAASSVATDMNSVAPESPTLPQLRGGGFSPDRSNSRMSKVGRQNYLNMGTPSPKSARSSRSARPAEGGTPRSPAKKQHASGGGEEKENSGRKRQREEDGNKPGGAAAGLARGGLKGSFRTSESPRRRLSVRFGDVKEHVYVGEREIDPQPAESSAEKQKRQRVGGERRAADRTSADSLGLYDKDGFLMSSPDRLPSAAAEGATGRPRSGLRV